MIKFQYKNHRGEIAERRVTPERIYWDSAPDYGYQPGWFLQGFDLDKENASRSFALTHIIIPQDTSYVDRRPVSKFLLWGEARAVYPYGGHGET